LAKVRLNWFSIYEPDRAQKRFLLFVLSYSVNIEIIFFGR